MEEDQWIEGADKVLSQSQQPLHYTEIKRRILDGGLVSPELKTTLEEALFKEIQRPGGRFRSIVDQPGVFELVQVKVEPEEAPKSILMHPPKTIPIQVKNQPHVIKHPVKNLSPNITPGSVKVLNLSPKSPVRILGPGSKIQGFKPARRPPIKIKSSNPSMSLVNQERYKKKYKALKRTMKDMVFRNQLDDSRKVQVIHGSCTDDSRKCQVNAAVCDEVIRIEERLQKTKDERRFLLARLLQHQSVNESQTSQGSPGSAAGSKHTAQSIAQILGEVEKRKKKTVPGMTPSGKKKTAKEILDDTPTKPKAKKRAGRRVVHPIPLDSLGRPIFPIELGNLTVYCIGEIVPERPGFHSTDYIFPAGYCSTRVYASVHHPEERCLYTCKISDLGAGPKFDISPEDAPELVFCGFSASECHLKLLKAINQISGRDVVPVVPRGDDFFGLSHPSVQNLIQSCPGAKRCTNYRWIKFDISKIPCQEVYDKDEPSVNIDLLYTMPAFTSAKQTADPQASLRTLLTTAANT